MIERIVLAAMGPSDLWYAAPLVVAVSLVYAATRHERTDLILRHAVRTAGSIVVFMAVVFAVLWLVTWWVSRDGVNDVAFLEPDAAMSMEGHAPSWPRTTAAVRPSKLPHAGRNAR
jgi:hypothetical protein